MGHTLSKEQQAQLALAYSYDDQRYDHHQHPTNNSSTSVASPHPSNDTTSSPRFYNLDSFPNAASLKRLRTLSALSSSLLNRHDSGYDSIDEDSHDELTIAASTNASRASLSHQEELLRDLAYVNKTYYPLLFVDNDENDNGSQRRQLEDMVNDIIEEEDEFERQVDPRWKKLVFGTVMQSSQVDLSCYSIVSLSPNVGLLYSVTHLNLSNNCLTMLPRTIGHLKNLVMLDVSQNKLRSIPDTISYISKLVDVNLADNKLSMLPNSIGSLKKLSSLLLNDNQITELPTEIGLMKSLITLDLSGNPLKVLPAELSRLQYLRRLRLEGCPLVEEFVHELVHNPPSLLELCARTIVRHQVPILASIPEDIKDYIASAKTCSFCGGPYFQSFVKRGKIVEKPEQVFVPLEYRLCAAHWNDEAERIRLMFAPLPDTALPTMTHGKGRKLRTKAKKTLDQAKRMSSIPNPSGSKSAPASQSHALRHGSISAATPSASASASTIPISSLAKVPSLPSLVLKRASRLPADFIPSTNSSTSLVSSDSIITSSAASSLLTLSLPAQPAKSEAFIQQLPSDPSTNETAMPNVITNASLNTATTESENNNNLAAGLGRWRSGTLKKTVARKSALFLFGEKFGFSYQHGDADERRNKAV